jgi:SAM-dependent methyltransferase
VQVKLLSILACPECRGGLSLMQIKSTGDGVSRGRLDCAPCGRWYPIERGIPRFVVGHPADASFGYQWNVFRQEQLDSSNGTAISARRFHAETGWTASDLDGAWVLDIGCGAGRFLEIAAQYSCEAVGVDVSNAIDAAALTLKGRPNAHLVQADVYRLPFRPGTFDACYCIGVAQHTPDPQRALAALPRLLKPGGRLAVTVYERKPWTRLNGKYLLRPFTRRLSKTAL